MHPPARFGALFEQQCLGATLGPSLDGADLAFVNARRPDHLNFLQLHQERTMKFSSSHSSTAQLDKDSRPER